MKALLSKLRGSRSLKLHNDLTTSCLEQCQLNEQDQMKLFERSIMASKPTSANEHKHHILHAKHSGRRVMIWACLAVKGKRRKRQIPEYTSNFFVSYTIV